MKNEQTPPDDKKTIKYDPLIHHRRSIRLKKYDYSQGGAYFITICCQDKTCRFGQVENNEMILNEYGEAARSEWLKLSVRYPGATFNVFQIMPNHIHGIIVLTYTVRTTFAVAPNGETGDIPNDEPWPVIRAGASPAPTVMAETTIGNIVGAYKSLTAKSCLQIYTSKNEISGKLWQRNYYEHIIRNEQSYRMISDYIAQNPSRWTQDKFFM